MSDVEEEAWAPLGDVGKSLRCALECPVCLETMGPPIMMCESGHNVCKNCRPRLSCCPTCRQPLLGTRNVALENLARELVPDVIGQSNEPSEPIYGCPLECPWTGTKSDIKVHTSMCHTGQMLMGTDDMSCQWELPLIVKDTRVMFAFGEVFRYRQRLLTLKKTFYIAVQYIGPRTQACRYKYEVELTGNSDSQKTVVTCNSTLEDHLNIDAVYEAGTCITLDYDLVKSVAKDKFVFCIRLIRIH